jgi:hypothetical protein
MSKHTPGPWEAERVYLTIEDPTMRITAYDGALYVAEAAYSHVRGERAIHVTDADEMRANARLIAAAPDLLEALRNFVDGCSLSIDAAAVARAAIAKATGEQA